MKLKVILISFSLVLSHFAFSCQCKTELKLTDAINTEFSNSDLVFIGKVITINNDKNSALIEISEVFKGDEQVKSRLNINFSEYCEPIIYFKGNWIIYAKKEKSNYHLNVCGLSRGFKKPEDNRYFRITPPPPPPPPLPSDTTTIAYINKPIPAAVERKNHRKAIKLLKKEVKILRAKINKRFIYWGH